MLTFFENIPFITILLYGFGIVFSFLFVIFSLVLVGQIASLRKVVHTGHGNIIYAITIGQLLIAIAIFLISLL